MSKGIFVRSWILALVVLVPVASAATGIPPIAGVSALQSGTLQAKGYLSATALRSDPLVQHLDFWMTSERSDAPIRRYDVDMTKLLHVIVVSDDLRQFMHIHPVLGADGHFTIDQRFPQPATYHVYADGEPHGFGHEVFRFDLPLGGGTAPRVLAPSATREVAAGPYTVACSTTALKAGRSTSVTVHVRRAGKPANDLHPYLGALAHVVVIGARDLSYVHVHPMPLGAGSDSMGGMGGMSGMNMSDMPMDAMPVLSETATSSPDMQLQLTLRDPGTYKMWIQFRGGAALYVAPFVVNVS
jgi:hypothetical protein